MTYRDDHDATLARAEALEREVERERRRADELQRQRDELAAKLGRAQPRTPHIPQKRVLILQLDPRKAATGGHEMLFLIAGIVGLFLLVAIMAVYR